MDLKDIEVLYEKLIEEYNAQIVNYADVNAFGLITQFSQQKLGAAILLERIRQAWAQDED